MKKIVSSLLIILCVLLCSCMKQSVVERKIKRIDQDPTHYVTAGQKTFTVTPQQSEQLKKFFLTLYFFPWDGDQTETNQFVLSKTQTELAYDLQNPGFTFNQHTYSPDDIKKFIENSNLEHYPSINKPGIMINFAEVRTFPTLLPSYNDPKKAGEGYPFDNWIVSLAAPGTPIRILEQSKDKIWYLIKTSSYYGWVPSETVAFVNDAFMQEWKKYPFLVSLQDDVPLQTQTGLTLFSMRKGVLYPSPAQGEKNQVLMPAIDNDGYARIISVFADSALTRPFPMTPTASSIAALAKTFIDSPYGWGGLYQLRDCSATMQDLFAGFGFWLPRNTLQQATMGEKIDLTGKTSEEKKRILHDQGVPFFTLIHFPGHIGLYLGEKNGVPYLLQEMWGIPTHDVFGNEGRAVVGRTGITTLELGKHYINVKQTQLDRADVLVILNPNSFTNPEDTLKNIWTVQPPAKK